MLYDLTQKKIQDTYHRLLQISESVVLTGHGNPTDVIIDGDLTISGSLTFGETDIVQSLSNLNDKVNEIVSGSEIFSQLQSSILTNINNIYPVSISWDIIQVIDDEYIHEISQPTKLQCSVEGWYDVGYKMSHIYGGKSCSSIQTVLRKNGMENLIESLDICKINEKSSNNWSGLLYLTVGEYIELIAANCGGTILPSYTIPNSSILTIRLLRRT